jgi:uncharacterized protein (TIGR04255 family)
MASGRLLDLPDLPRIQLERPPLRLVVCQVQFDTSINVEDPSIVAPIQQAIKASFPKVGMQPIGLNMQVSPKGFQQRTTSQWVFSDEENVWVASLAANSLTLQTREYHRFEDFEERFGLVFDAVLLQLGALQITRFGLRMVNEIRESSTSLDIGQIVRSELLGPLNESSIAAHVTRIVTELQLQDEVGMQLVVRYGRLLAGTSIPRPDEPPPDDQFFLLDMDAFETAEDDATSPRLEPDSLGVRLKSYHRTAYRFFRWAISDKYLEEVAK